jgi:hypothetical protein
MQFLCLGQCVRAVLGRVYAVVGAGRMVDLFGSLASLVAL